MDEELEEQLFTLDRKLGQLKLEYEKYFLGSRPTEPAMQRGDLQRAVTLLSNTAIRNTAARFRFNSIHSRYQALKRQWDLSLRQIEAGTYKRHVFKADLHNKERNDASAPAARRGTAEKPDERLGRLFDAYVEASNACGQSTRGLSHAKLASVIEKQEVALRKKLGCSDVKFRVVVEQGKVKLKASAGG